MAKHFITTNKEQGTFPFSFQTMNEQILEATEWAKKRQRYPFTHYALNVNLSGCLSIGLFDEERLLQNWLVNGMGEGISGYSRLMRVGKVEELIGKRLFDWNRIRPSFVWAVARNETTNTGRSAVLGDVNLCWLSVSKEQEETISEVVLKVRGCNREDRELWATELDFFRSNKKVVRIVEHRWFGVVYKNIYGTRNRADSYGSTLPHMAHNFHEVVSGNYSMLYTPHLMGK